MDTTRGCDWIGTRAPKSFSGAAPAGAAVSPESPSPGTLTLNRCLAQPPGCDQQPQSSQPQTLGYDASPLASRTAPHPRAMHPSTLLTPEA